MASKPNPRARRMRAWVAILLTGMLLSLGRSWMTRPQTVRVTHDPAALSTIRQAMGPESTFGRRYLSPVAQAGGPNEKEILEDVDRLARRLAEELLDRQSLDALEEDSPSLSDDPYAQAGEGEAVRTKPGNGGSETEGGGQVTSTAEPAVDGGPWELDETAQAEIRERLGEAPVDEGAAVNVYVVPIHGPIDLGLSAFVDRVYREARAQDVVVLDVNTPGGRIDAAIQIRDRILSAECTTIAWMNPRAISAGALISLASDLLVTGPGGTIGAATPIQVDGGEARPVEEKLVSYFRGEMRSTAESRERPGDIAEAMVDHHITIAGLIGDDDTLTLTSEQALSWGVAEARASSMDEVLALAGLGRAQIRRPQIELGERAARFLTDPVVAGLLMSLGTVGLIVELWRPGFGLPGIAGFTCLALFFFGHFAANLAGFEELILFMVGTVLLLLEAFVIPGFGVAGITGIICLGMSLVLAMISMDVGTSLSTGTFWDALARVFASFFVSGLAIVGLAYFLPKSRFGAWMVLDKTLNDDKPGSDDPARAPTAAPGMPAVGSAGVSLTPLRPSGFVRIDGRRVDVQTQGDWVARGVDVQVIAVEGTRVLVAPIDAE